MLAGGALRDLYFGREVKDLDIFISAGGYDEAEGIYQKLGGTIPQEDWAYGLEPADGQASAYPESMPEVILVIDYPKETETPPVQLIFVNWQTHSIMERFDIGICRVMFNGGLVDFHQDFKDAERDEVLNVVRCKGKIALGSTIKRLHRLWAKYPEFDLRLDINFEIVEDNGLTCAPP